MISYEPVDEQRVFVSTIIVGVKSITSAIEWDALLVASLIMAIVIASSMDVVRVDITVIFIILEVAIIVGDETVGEDIINIVMVVVGVICVNVVVDIFTIGARRDVTKPAVTHCISPTLTRRAPERAETQQNKNPEVVVSRGIPLALTRQVVIGKTVIGAPSPPCIGD